MPDDTLPVTLREGRPSDQAAVGALTDAAFAPMPFSDGREGAIAGALRTAGAAGVALVAERDGAVAGQVLPSPATVGGRPSSWFALGPVAVAREVQRRGIGRRLIVEGLQRVRALGAEGCIVLGDPGYYARFGFAAAPALAPPGVPAQLFMALPFVSALPSEPFGFHPTLGTTP